MTTQTQCAPAPVLSVIDHKVTALSSDVANSFGKLHKDVLRAIRSLIKQAPELNGRNFAPVELVDAKGEKRPAYRMDRKGFVLLAMGFTGPVALKFKMAYIDEYDRMERKLYQCPVLNQSESLSPAQQLALRNAVAKRAQKTPSSYRFIYSALKQRFQVARYSQIKAVDFEAALTFIEALVLPLPAPKPAEYNAENQSYKLTISRRELERFGNFIYNWRYLFHDALVLYVNHLIAVKSPYVGKLYDATFDTSLWQLEELFREHGISIGPDLPNPERLRTLAYSI